MKEHLRVVILGIIMLFSANAFGELVSPPDAASIEAMIANHKTYKSFLRYRVVSEKGLDSIHGTTVKEVSDYKETSDKLDKYKRGLKLISAILQGAGTVIHLGNTLNVTKNNLESYLTLLDDYRKEFLMKGDIFAEDSILYTTSYELFKNLKTQSNQLWQSLIEFEGAIAASSTGITQSTVYETINIMSCVDENMDKIAYSVNSAYYRLWAHMMMRRFYHKKGLYGTSRRKEILEGTFTCWEKAQRIAADVIINRRPMQKSKLLGGGGLLGEQRRKEG